MLEIIKKTLTDNLIIGAIFSSVLIILLGFMLRRTKIISKNTAEVLSKIVLTASLPALAFSSFMKDIDEKKLKSNMVVLMWGVIFYALLILVSKIIYIKIKGEKQDVFRVLTIFGSTMFFGLPIVKAVYGEDGVMYANTFNIAYAVLLYSYAYIKMSGEKIDKHGFRKTVKEIFFNPMIIATFLGLFIWVFQNYLFQVKVLNGNEVISYGFLRIDKTIPWAYKPIVYLARLASPLAWLSIGATLAEVSFKKAIERLDVWLYSLIKVMFIPFLNLFLLIILTKSSILDMPFVALATTVLLMATPTAAVVAAYGIRFNREAIFTSDCSFLSTLVAVVCMPIWIITLQIISSFKIV